MKNLVLIFFSVWSFSQQQFRTSDFGYSDDVVKVEESLYKFSKETKEFVIENAYTTEIKNKKVYTTCLIPISI